MKKYIQYVISIDIRYTFFMLEKYNFSYNIKNKGQCTTGPTATTVQSSKQLNF